MERMDAPAAHRRLPIARLWLLLAALAPIGGCECTSTLPVVPNPLPPLSAVELSPETDTLRVGEERQFSAVAYDTLSQLVLTAGFLWSSGDPTVFTVTRSGRVTAVGDGVAWLYAEAGGRRDSASVYVYPDSGWIVQTSNTNRNLNGVFFLPNGREGWAVGEVGTIMHTTDAGVTWRSQVSQASAHLNDVFFTDADNGWAVGNLGTVLRTSDRGTTWERRVISGVGDNLTDVHFATGGMGFVVGSAGVVLRTLDGGQTWQKQTLTGVVLRGVAFTSAGQGWAVGDNGEIFGTDDAGAVWTRVQPAVTGLSLRAVSRRSGTAAWAVGAQGTAPRTADVGGTVVWQNDNLGASNDFEGVHFPADTLVGYASGFNASGLILKSEDGGLNWTRQVSNTSRRLNDVHFVDRLRGWAVGEAGTIIHTALGGVR
jgi:photosystem II stability/assembly factor-like uncharacterized protein